MIIEIKSNKSLKSSMIVFRMVYLVTTQKNFKLWYSQYLELKKNYCQNNGRVIFKIQNEKTVKLAQWMSKQQYLMRRDKVQSWQIDLLKEIGEVPNMNKKKRFEFADDDRKRKNWEEYYENLKEYKSRNGDCDVSRKENQRLARWTSYQRRLNYENKMSQERKRMLDDLEFRWEKRIRRIQSKGTENKETDYS